MPRHTLTHDGAAYATRQTCPAYAHLHVATTAFRHSRVQHYRPTGEGAPPQLQPPRSARDDAVTSTTHTRTHLHTHAVTDLLAHGTGVAFGATAFCGRHSRAPYRYEHSAITIDALPAAHASMPLPAVACPTYTRVVGVAPPPHTLLHYYIDFCPANWRGLS